MRAGRGLQWSRPEQAVILLALCAALAGGARLILLRRPAPPVRVIEPPAAIILVVQVDGEVFRPGLHQLPAGSRVADALDAAGGTTPNAEVSGVNLARLVRDGERISVPSRLPAASPHAPAAPHAINLNTATAAQLEGLPGIGPVLARRIIEHRTRNGPIQRLEELLQAGERRIQMMRAFNQREGFSSKDDVLPQRVYEPKKGGRSDGLFVTKEELEQAKRSYYRMAGWDQESGNPPPETLRRVGLDWRAAQPA